MAKFKINKNKTNLPEKLINRHKDFSKLMDSHQKIAKYKDATKPLYKNPGFMSFLIVLSVVLLTFIITEKEKDDSVILVDSINIDKKVIITPVGPLEKKSSDTIDFNKSKSKVIK